MLGSLSGLCLETDLILAYGVRVEAKPFYTGQKNTVVSQFTGYYYRNISVPLHLHFTPLEHLFIKSFQNHNSSTFPYAKVLQLFLRLKSVGKQETKHPAGLVSPT